MTPALFEYLKTQPHFNVRTKRSLFEDDLSAGAVYDIADPSYRYMLWRGEPGGKVVNFVMLNGSTAGEDELDPTVGRCCTFAQAWGYDVTLVTNAFAYMATEPDTMMQQADPVGPHNNQALLLAAKNADLVVCAWGIHGAFCGRDKEVVALLRGSAVFATATGIELHTIGPDLTMTKQPRHPLYLPGNLQPVRWL